MAFDTIPVPNADGTDIVEVVSPYNFLTKNATPVQLYQTNAPFSLTYIRYVHDKESPFQSVMLSPDFVLNNTLSREEFERLVLGRPLHQHNTYELLYVRSGELYQRIENTRHKYVTRSCCLLNRSIRHTEEYSTDFDIVNLSISRDLLISILKDGEKNYFRTEKTITPSDLVDFLSGEFEQEGYSHKKFIDFHPRSSGTQTDTDLSSMFDQMAFLIRYPNHGTSFLIRALIYSIFTALNNKELYDTTPIQLGTPTECRLFARITERMEQTDGRVGRTQLAEELNYSGNYLNKIVQKFSGMSIFDYGNSFTMQKAASLLRGSDMTISDISIHLGFTDRTHFYKLFKNEFGMTPREYRQKSKSPL